MISVSDVLAPRMKARTYRHLALRLGRDMEMVIKARTIHDLKIVVSLIVEAQKRRKDLEHRVAALRCQIVRKTNEDHGKVLCKSKDT